ncbi:YncE family protein [Bacillus carboniphilus]|uniref:YncE family protein n=1 Tax=Bacillus carboniphilus TaxID=86663 RepID=A0ABY9JXM0_9BACI|nr:YncE family protein [Bacillus carboniphilus]WLR43258.1 YncE family protein [Bacillus carboniphilus]
MVILFTTGPVDNTDLALSNIEVRVRNTDPSNNAMITVRLLDESSSPESLNNSDSFTVSANSTESVLFSAASLSSFLIEVEVNLANRSDIITTTAIHPTVTLFNEMSEFVQFIRLLVSSPEDLLEINYPATPQLNLFIPDMIDCYEQISGNLTTDQMPISGVDITFEVDVTSVSFFPNPSVTDGNGNFVSTVSVGNPTVTQQSIITAKANVNGQNIQIVGLTEVMCIALLYVTNFDSNNISVIDVDTNSVIDTITGFTKPTGIDVNSITELVYAYNTVDSSMVDTITVNAVSVIEVGTNIINTTITAGEEVGLFGVAVNLVENYICLANETTMSTVIIIDGETNLITNTVTVGNFPRGVGIDEIRNLIYVTNDDSSVSIIDGNQGFVVTTTINVGDLPEGLAINEVTNRIYVANLASNNVSVIDGNTFNIIATATVNNVPRGVDINESTNTIYVANGASDNISVIDGWTNIVLITVTVGFSPLGIKVVESLNYVYVTNENNISVIDGDLNMIIATVTVGDRPLAITFV